MNWLDLDMGGPLEVSFSQEDPYALDGYCEDDAKVVAPFLHVCPDESDHEDGSPLRFK